MKRIIISGYYSGGEFELSKDVSAKEIKDYFDFLLIENKINNSDITQHIKEKIQEGHLIYPGGMAFYDSEKYLITGCCFGLNDLKEACTNIINSNSTWLGHDPNLTTKYVDDKVVFFESEDFEDEQDVDGNEIVIFTKDEINDLLLEANEKTKEFINIFYVFLNNTYPDIAGIVIEDLKKCLM